MAESIGAALASVLADLADRLDERRPAALADEPDAVHQLRTTVRRLRNLLAAFGRYLDPAAADQLGEGLASYGDLLGRCRDLEVRVAHCCDVLVRLDLEEELTGPLVLPLRAEHAIAHAALVTWHSSPARSALDAVLQVWRTAPPLSGRADKDAVKQARRAVRKQVRRTLAAADAVDLGAVELTDDAHHLRKAARRLRHTADAVTREPAALLDGPAADAGGLGQRIQGLLGDHRDALLLAAHVRDHAAAIDGAAPSSYGMAVGYLEGTAAAAVEDLPGVVDDLRALAD